jgi:hypothetical protein
LDLALVPGQAQVPAQVTDQDPELLPGQALEPDQARVTAQAFRLVHPGQRQELVPERALVSHHLFW